mmetsp:Transcript_15623/g.33717  ORF Transcript_15623/g.33717 Transcript_15623/m.33717 type:complete len:204 (-) Transcript_15623:1243-1854(-)
MPINPTLSKYDDPPPPTLLATPANDISSPSDDTPDSPLATASNGTNGTPPLTNLTFLLPPLASPLVIIMRITTGVTNLNRIINVVPCATNNNTACADEIPHTALPLLLLLTSSPISTAPHFVLTSNANRYKSDPIDNMPTAHSHRRNTSPPARAAGAAARCGREGEEESDSRRHNDSPLRATFAANVKCTMMAMTALVSGVDC